jgi:predicted transcriptional regulator
MNNDSTVNKIVRDMQRAKQPLILNHIAKRTKLAPQLVDYHLERLIKDGVALCHEELGEKYYCLQEIFYDNDWLVALYKQLEPFVRDVSSSTVVTDQMEGQRPKAVVNMVIAFLRRFEQELMKDKDVLLPNSI